MLSSTRCSERTNAEARWSVSNQTQRHCPIWIEMFDILTSLRQIKAFPCSKSRYKSKVCTVYTSTSEWCTSYSKIILLAWIWKFESSDFTGLNAWTQKFLVSILFWMRHTSKFERMNARTHKNFDAKKFEGFWLYCLNARTNERRCFWSQFRL